MLADVAPELEAVVEAVVQDAPVHDRDEEGVCGYAGPEEGVQGLEGARESVEEGRAAVDGVGEGVDGGGEEVERETPVAEDGEIGEGEVHCAGVVVD